MEKRKILLHDALCTLLLLCGAVAVCSVLSRVHDDNNPFAVLIFVLAVAIVALVTTGYVWGVVASVVGVFCVNYMFAYPFWSFDMSISGYPLTFMVMLVVSVVISTLTTRLKQTERLPQVQLAILSQQANYVRPGGVLLYSTCTILRRENEAVVQKFLDDHPLFSAETVHFPESSGIPDAAMTTLLPCDFGTDGFFICKLRRKP